MDVGVVLQAVDPPDAFVRFVRRIEEAGFTYVGLCDSSLKARDVYAYLALAARETRRITLGVHVAHPYTRHPAITLNAALTLDEMAGGRALLGIGVGDSPVTELGLTRAPLETVREVVALWRRMLTGEVVHSDGRACRVTGGALRIPARRDLPIGVAATGPRMLALAGEVADLALVNCGVDPEVARVARGHIATGEQVAGRTLSPERIAFFAPMCLTEDVAVARNACRPLGAWYARNASGYLEAAGIAASLIARIRAVYAGGEFHEARDAIHLTPDEVVDRFTLAGPADHCAKMLEALAAAGVRSVHLFPLGPDRERQIVTVARDVLPYLAGR